MRKGGRNSKPRQTAILLHLQQKGRASVDELAELLNATPQTIRKDLNQMAEDSKIMRFHGGAALLAGSEYTGFEARKEIARNEKERIGSLAAKKIPNNASVIVNAGTTTAAVARSLIHHVGLKVVTDSVNVANEIREFPGIEVMVPGGFVRRTDGVIFGETAVDFIRQFRADIAVIGTAAIAGDGSLLDYDLREASVARAIIESARHVMLTVDSTKFDRIAPVCIGHISQIHTLVTDAGCSQKLTSLCKAHDVNLFVAR